MQNRRRGCLRLLGTTAVSRQEGRLRLSDRNALMHDYLVGANFTTAPRLKEKFFAFAPDVLGLFYSRLLPWEFIYAKLRNLTISSTWLGGEICSSDVNMHKGHSLLMT